MSISLLSAEVDPDNRKILILRFRNPEHFPNVVFKARLSVEDIELPLSNRAGADRAVATFDVLNWSALGDDDK